jgi:hypothetical protein
MAQNLFDHQYVMIAIMDAFAVCSPVQTFPIRSVFGWNLGLRLKILPETKHFADTRRAPCWKSIQ